jgi:hypothetical protein
LEALQILETGLTDQSLPAISRMRALKSLRLDGHPITDAGLTHLRTLGELQHLSITDTQAGDRTLAAISELSRLNGLFVSGTAVSDAGLIHVASLTKLKRLDVMQTGVTDAGLMQLGMTPNLSELNVSLGNGITRAGIDALKAVVPNCEIGCFQFRPDGSGSLVESQ